MRSWGFLAALVLATACAGEPHEPATGAPGSALRVELASWRGLDVIGVGAPRRPDTDERPRYDLYVGARWIDRDVVDAAVDDATGTLAWIDVAGTLWVAPIDRAPERRRAAAERAIPGLAAARGRLAFAARTGPEDGPETAPFVVDLATLRVAALDDGPGPDEVLAWSPEGDEVLLLSARTGLASLFAARVDAPGVRQLTNVGLAPGRGLDPARVAPAPIDHRGVAWGRRGVAYRAEDGVVWVAPDGELVRLDGAAAPGEVVR